MIRPTSEETWQLWCDKSKTRKAIALLDALGRTKNEQGNTWRRVAYACYHAMHYKPNTDPGVLYRQRMAEQRLKAKRLAGAARMLAKSCERGDPAMLWAIDAGDPAVLNGATLTRPGSTQAMPVLQMAGPWFSELARLLEGRLPEVHGGNFTLWFTIGNMLRDKPIRAGARTKVATMLAFELTFCLRMHTAGRAMDSTQLAQTMPKDGKPSGDVVAAFVNAAFNLTLDRKQIADLVASIPADVGLISWPSEAV